MCMMLLLPLACAFNVIESNLPISRHGSSLPMKRARTFAWDCLPVVLFVVWCSAVLGTRGCRNWVRSLLFFVLDGGRGWREGGGEGGINNFLKQVVGRRG